VRVQSETIAQDLGVTPRMVRALAQRGELPGAAKIGSVWTFDREKVKAWLHRKEREAARCRVISTGAKASGMAAYGSTVGMRDEAYERLIGLKP
jgi:excisionase family DNA binding protein